ncbi:MAG: dihydroorotate dehydrogenase [Gordonibacter sp.]|uniref:dihydroorotate dehydrogenase n=1 Tax=Gordonibacter sp. TaxID=1968902 RepID=UPI002FCBA9E8
MTSIERHQPVGPSPRQPRPTSVDMAVNLGGLDMKNPVTVASGTFAAGREYHDFVDVATLGAVTTKGVSLNGWEGNASPRIAETPCGMLNSIGLQNPGVAHLKEHDLPWLAERGAAVIVNVSGHSFDEYVAVIEALEDAPVHAYEVNISCPNVDAGGLTIGTSSSSVEAVVSRCRAATKRPLIVKLTPNVTDITEIARAAEAAGADALSLINTLLGMAIDAKHRRPQLARVVGGLSGPAVKPVALRMVWECHKAVKIPLLGMGGISTGIDAVEFMLAGATAVAAGTVNFANPCATVEIIEGIAQYCEEEGVKDVKELIGALEC